VTGFVIDASVALAWCFDDEATEATRALLDRFEDERAEVPSLWHLELANALAMGERNKRITLARASEFIADRRASNRDRRADPQRRPELCARAESEGTVECV
jgi:predicted nucleic acid-binding protein